MSGAGEQPFRGSGPLAILGGAGGIGQVLVRAATDFGFEPIVLDLPASLEAHPPDVPSHAVDATAEAALAATAQALPDSLSGLVCLSGFMRENQPLSELPPQVWDDVISGNLTATYLATRSLAPRVRKGGAVVLTGSGLGHFPRPGYGPYAISKAGIAAMTRQLALEMAPDVRVNCVAPSAVDTAFLLGGTGRSGEDAPPAIDIAAYSR
ncbi:MAG: SDR family NAD(P)-dependent oxidoreductase, partial [Pseudomonadota bacterium]